MSSSMPDSASTDKAYLVYVRKAGAKRAEMLTPRGGVTRLRIHAARFTREGAELAAREINEENVGEWTAEARPIGGAHA